MERRLAEAEELAVTMAEEQSGWLEIQLAHQKQAKQEWQDKIDDVLLEDEHSPRKRRVGSTSWRRGRGRWRAEPPRG